jgi:hypothetical protein
MGRAPKIILVFVLVGPLIGLATFAALLSIATASQREAVQILDQSVQTGDPVGLGFFVLMLGGLLAHYVGAVWAALAGAIVALRSHLWGPASIYEGVPIGCFTALAAVVAWDLTRVEYLPLDTIQTQVAAGWALVNIVPTMTCIWLTRTWQQRG